MNHNDTDAAGLVAMCKLGSCTNDDVPLNDAAGAEPPASGPAAPSVTLW
ncbi:hypothetical protein [Fodinicola feengrottensis]|nr:hypothetical protein [Fodinicola feengrottensis]